MARTKTKTIDTSIAITDADTPGLPAMVAAANQATAADAMVMQQYPALIRIGRIQVHVASQILHRVAVLKEFELAKNLNDYKGIPYRTASGEVRRVADLEEYCQAFLGCSYRALAEDAQNAKTFTEEGFSNGLEMGLTTVQLRDLRKLPEDAQVMLKLALQASDKDAVLEILQDVVVRNDKQQTELTKQVANLKADAEATDKVMGGKSAKIDRLEKEIHKLRNKAGDWHPRVFEIAMENTRVLGLTMQGLDQLDTLRDVILNEEFGEQDREAAVEMMAVVYYDACNQIMGRLAEVMAACDHVFIGYKEKARPMLSVFAAQSPGE